MNKLTDKGYIRDKNFDDCLNWLFDRLALTPEEEMLLKYGRLPEKKEKQEKQPAYKRMSEEEKAFIYNNYNKMTTYELAKKLNRSETAIMKFLARNSLKKTGKVGRSRTLNYEQIMYIRENHNRMSIALMAENLGIGYMTVYRTIKKLGLISHYGSDKEKIMKLNETEINVLERMAKGLNDFEIANDLGKATYHIRNCVKKIYSKLGLNEFSYPVKRVKAVLIYQSEN